LPRSPILLLDDIPILLVSSYELAGPAEPPEEHVAYFKEHGRIRDKPLVPGDSPLRLYHSYVKAAVWPDDAVIKRCKKLIANQLLALLDSVYRSGIDDYGYRFNSCDDMDGRWKKVELDVSKLDIRWSAKKCCYTFKGGACLPEPVQTIH
jgi:hypothetical protein